VGAHLKQVVDEIYINIKSWRMTMMTSLKFAKIVNEE
jgi:hypothetical protein